MQPVVGSIAPLAPHVFFNLIEPFGPDTCAVVAHAHAQDAIIAHFETLAGATDLPMILYDIPHRAGRPIEADSLMRLVGHSNIVVVKDAKNDITGSA